MANAFLMSDFPHSSHFSHLRFNAFAAKIDQNGFTGFVNVNMRGFVIVSVNNDFAHQLIAPGTHTAV